MCLADKFLLKFEARGNPEQNDVEVVVQHRSVLEKALLAVAGGPEDVGEKRRNVKKRRECIKKTPKKYNRADA